MFVNSVLNLEVEDLSVKGGYWPMNDVPKTQEALLLLFVKSVDGIIDAIEKKDKELKKAKDDDDITKLHYSRKLIQDWFRNKGGIPIPD